MWRIVHVEGSRTAADAAACASRSAARRLTSARCLSPCRPQGMTSETERRTGKRDAGNR